MEEAPETRCSCWSMGLKGARVAEGAFDGELAVGSKRRACDGVEGRRSARRDELEVAVLIGPDRSELAEKVPDVLLPWLHDENGEGSEILIRAGL